MAKQRTDRQVYTETVITNEGELVSSKTVYKTQTEPDFVKLYIDCVFVVKGVKKGFSPIFLAFLEHMSYADTNDEYGGQVIYVNKAMKMSIAKKVGLSIVSVNNALTDFVKTGVFKRVDVGTYQVNPNIVGRGEWKDIKNIRASFDFANRDVVADIVREEEKEMTENQQRLSEDFQQTVAQLDREMLEGIMNGAV